MIIEIKNLSKKYKKRKIFDHFNLEIEEGTFTTIFGKSGSGKSTLLNIIGLIEDYDEGEFHLSGQFAPLINSGAALKYRRWIISYLFQSFALLEDESIEKNLQLSLVYSKLSKKEKKGKIKEILEKVKLKQIPSTKVYSLSGGEKQRVALARALLKESKIILADEPTGSLDIETRNDILQLLLDEVKLNHKTVVVVSHDPYLKKISDQLIEI